MIHAECACGSKYSRKAWRGLHYVGLTISDSPGDYLEQRNCTCGSTIAAPFDPSTLASDEQRAQLLADLRAADERNDWPMVEALLRQIDALTRERLAIQADEQLAAKAATHLRGADSR